jgi:hypothetical protein
VSDFHDYEFHERVRHYEYEPIVILREPADGSGVLERWDASTSSWVDGSDQRRLLDGGMTYAPISAQDAEDSIARRSVPVARVEPLPTDSLAFTTAINDGWGRLQTAAIAMHEMFTSLVNAGFTEDQALTLVRDVVRHARDERRHIHDD